MDPKLLELRKLGSSDAACVLKLFPFKKTPYMLWEEIVHRVKREGNSSMKYGQMMEEPSRQYFEEVLDTIFFGDFPIQHPEYEFMTATLDGIDLEKTIVIEIKNTNKQYHELAKSGSVPCIYYPQIQHQLAIVNALYGIKEIHYCSCFQGDYHHIVVPLNKEFIDKMIEEEKMFWNEYVLKKTPPPLTEYDYKEMDENWEKMARKKWRISQLIKKLENKEKELQETLILSADNKNCKTDCFRLTRSHVEGRVDIKKIPIDLEPYRKNPTTKWRLDAIK